MRKLNLNHLHTLQKVLALGSFSAAARALNLSQPAVSQQIRELETRFDVKLVERLGRRSFATVPGEALLKHAATIFAACTEASEAMNGYRDGWLGRVRLSTTLTALMYSLPPILKRLRADYPGLELVVSNMPTRDSVAAIVDNTADLALVTLPVEDARLRITPLRDEMLVALLPREAGRAPKVVTPDYAAGQMMLLEHDRGSVYRLVMDWLAPHLPLAVPPLHMGTIEGAKRGVAAGLGMTFVPDVAAEPGPRVFVRPIQPAVPCVLGLIELRTRSDDRALVIVRTALLGLSAAATRSGPVPAGR